MNEIFNNLNFILGGGGILSILAGVYALGKFHNRFEKLEKSNSEFRTEMKDLRVDLNREMKENLREFKTDIKEMIHDLKIENQTMKELLYAVKIDVEDLKRKKVG
jgi:gas vesicle protein